MPEEFIANMFGQMWNVVLEAALAFWKELVFWVQENILVWIKDDGIALAAETVRLALTALGQAPRKLHNAIKNSWNSLKRFLIEAFVTFEQSVSSPVSWIRRLSSKALRTTSSTNPVIVSREVEEKISWEDLPPEIRASWIQSSQSSYDVDIMSTRDMELRTLQMNQ
jgi:hypothetical protein